MSNIPQISTANTFGQWVTSTQSVISKLNNLTDGGSSQIFYANTNLTLDGKANVSGDMLISGDLTITGNINLDQIGFDDINANGSGYFANNLVAGGFLQVTGNTTLSNASINYSNQETANITLLVGQSNTAIYANIAAAAISSSGDGLAFAIALG